MRRSAAKAKTRGVSANTPTIRVDTRGLRCPVNWAKTKSVLEGMPAGTTVEVLVDDPRSERDLPIAAEAEGYAVLALEPQDGHLKILIEK